MKKYQVDINHIPPLGINFDNEQKNQEIEEDIDDKTQVNSLSILNEEIDCFEERPNLEGYILP